MTSFLLPPDFPDVMKSQEIKGQEQSPDIQMTDDIAPVNAEVLCSTSNLSKRTNK